jgi:hypothetical protein
MKKEGNEFLSSSFFVLELSLIAFPPQAPQKQQGTIFHTTALRERPPVHQQANKSTTRKGITQDKLKRLKMAFHRAQATSQ